MSEEVQSEQDQNARLYKISTEHEEQGQFTRQQLLDTYTSPAQCEGLFIHVGGDWRKLWDVISHWHGGQRDPLLFVAKPPARRWEGLATLFLGIAAAELVLGLLIGIVTMQDSTSNGGVILVSSVFSAALLAGIGAVIDLLGRIELNTRK